MVETTLANKSAILAELWLNYSDDVAFSDFFEYNDLGLPLAYALDNDIVVANERTANFIDETFALFLAGLGVEDTGFTTLNEILELPEE